MTSLCPSPQGNYFMTSFPFYDCGKTLEVMSTGWRSVRSQSPLGSTRAPNSSQKVGEAVGSTPSYISSFRHVWSPPSPNSVGKSGGMGWRGLISLTECRLWYQTPCSDPSSNLLCNLGEVTASVSLMTMMVFTSLGLGIDEMSKCM